MKKCLNSLHCAHEDSRYEDDRNERQSRGEEEVLYDRIVSFFTPNYTGLGGSKKVGVTLTTKKKKENHERFGAPRAFLQGVLL